MATSDPEIVELQTSIEQSKLTRAGSLSISEKLRLGADLHDEGMRWMIQFIKAENSEFDELQIDAEIERRKRIKRRIDEAGLYEPCGAVNPDD